MKQKKHALRAQVDSRGYAYKVVVCWYDQSYDVSG